MPEPSFDRIAVIGLGLIGGSFAAAAKARGLAKTVVAGSRSALTLEQGIALGVVDDGYQDLAKAVEGADLVFVSTPVSAMENVFSALAPGLSKTAIVTDGGSVKGSVIAAARASLGSHFFRFVPGHPIAGKEKSGVNAADATLYQDHRVILTPETDTDPAATAKVRALWTAMGAEVLQMTPEYHDQVLAETSHLPHLLAFSLVDTLARQGDSTEIFRYAAGGFRDFTRIASSDPVMWRDIFTENKASLLASLNLFRQGIDRFQAAIENADTDALMGIMTRANSARAHFMAMNGRTSYTRAQLSTDDKMMTDTSQVNTVFLASPGGQLQGRLRVPGDKSMSHRSIMLGSLAQGVTEVDGFLEGEDALATLQAFRDMGVVIEGPHNGQVTIHGVGLHGLQAPEKPLYMGNSGTSMRLLTGLLAGQKFDVELTGDASLSKRPMERVAKPLREMGAQITTGHEGRPPVRIRGGQTLTGIHYDLPMASAQVKSAVLLGGLYAEGKTSVTEPAPTRDHTERMLGGFGYAVERDGATSAVMGNGSLTGGKLEVPADISSAAFFLVGASIAQGSEVTLPHVGINPTRTGVIDILKLMGADIRLENQRDAGGEPVADIVVKSAPLKGIVIPEDLVPLAIDEFPAIFIAAACAEGDTILHGAEELRVKETDRIGATARGLEANGVVVHETTDSLSVEGCGAGGVPGGGEVISHFDHRIAMSFLVMSLAAKDPIAVDDTRMIATSFPSFIGLMEGLGARFK